MPPKILCEFFNGGGSAITCCNKIILVLSLIVSVIIKAVEAA
jgi:hypothetical protein